MESLKFLLFAGVLSATFSWLSIPLILRHIAPFFKVRLAGLRDLHEENIPRLGGIGILFGLVCTIICFEWMPLANREIEWASILDTKILVLCLGSTSAWILGFLDDIVNLKARWKLPAQLALGFMTAYSGFRIQVIDLPFLGVNTDIGYLSWPVTVLWIVVVINAVNLIDGMDGLAGGIVITSSAVLILITFFNDDIAVAMLLMMVVGATFGFWLFNRPPAVIFMGDSGSHLLGYLLAILSLWATENSRNSQTLTPLLVLAVPLLDTMFALFRRYLKGIPFYSADRDHLHHRLLNKGFSPEQTVWLMIGISVIYGSLGGMMFFVPKLQGFAFLGAVLMSYFILYWMEYDAVRKPFSSALKHSDYKQKRSLMLALAKGIDDYLSKDPDIDSILRSFCYWTDLAGVSRMELYQKDSMIKVHGPIDHSHRRLFFRKNEWEVCLALSETDWTVDSDVKNELLEHVSLALINRLEQLDSH